MTASEYGRIVNALAPVIQEEIDAARLNNPISHVGPEPKIVVQVGQYGAFSQAPGHLQNQQIISEIGDQAAAAIDAVTRHFYIEPKGQSPEDHDWLFERLSEWTDDPRLATTETWITEWNVSLHAPDTAGLRLGGALLSMFGEMVRNGVDAAWAWPVQQNTFNDFFGDEGELKSTVGGETFRMLSGLSPGALLIQDGYENGLHTLAFEDAERVTILVTNWESTVRDLKLDLGEVGKDIQFTWSQTIRVLGAPEDPNASPELAIHTDISFKDGTVDFVLEPYEIIKVELVSEGYGARIEGQLFWNAPAEATNRNDDFSGSPADDTILGHIGNDSISGNQGNDLLFGGEGDDKLYGGNGNDLLVTGPGSDVADGGTGRDIFISSSRDLRVDDIPAYLKYDLPLPNMSSLSLAVTTVIEDQLECAAVKKAIWPASSVMAPDSNSMNSWVDTLTGGAGNDFFVLDDLMALVDGGSGDDYIIGGRNNDTITGGDGNDTLVISGGDDRLSGGSGADTFIFADVASSGQTHILDFDPADDRFRLDDGEDLQSTSFSPMDDWSEQDCFTVLGGDIVFANSTGAEIWFLGIVD